MHTSDVIGSAIHLEPNLCAENNGVEDVMIISVDLNRRGVRLGTVLFVIIVEVRFAEPAAVHHHFVTGVDLQAELSEVQKVPAVVRETRKR